MGRAASLSRGRSASGVICIGHENDQNAVQDFFEYHILRCHIFFSSINDFRIDAIMYGYGGRYENKLKRTPFFEVKWATNY